MITSRRGFIGSILALGVAPAIVKAESLMKIVVPSNKILMAKPWPHVSDGITVNEVPFTADCLVIKDSKGNVLFSATRDGGVEIKSGLMRGGLWIDPRSGKLSVWNHEEWQQVDGRVRRKQVV